MDNVTERIMYPVKLERVTARIAPAPAPWEVLTADHARDYANYFTGMLELETADHFIAYADAWDAMTQPTRIEYETETA